MNDSEDSGIQAGAVVQLKSGSPPMTVRGPSASNPGEVVVDWYDAGQYSGHQKGFQRETFTIAQLTTVDAPQGRL